MSPENNDFQETQKDWFTFT